MVKVTELVNKVRRQTGADPEAGIQFGEEPKIKFGEEYEASYQDVTLVKDAADKLLTLLLKLKDKKLNTADYQKLESVVNRTQTTLGEQILKADTDPNYISSDDHKFLIEIRDKIKYAFQRR